MNTQPGALIHRLHAILHPLFNSCCVLFFGLGNVSADRPGSVQGDALAVRCRRHNSRPENKYGMLPRATERAGISANAMPLVFLG
jgi:hypothetical protein